MASWIWASSPFDVLVDKATSPLLPIGTQDIATSLEIADQIRAKTVTPKAAIGSLKRKVGDKNPNVQLLAIGLLDLCIKNGGDHFLDQVATRDFVDNLASILRLQTTNQDVKKLGLEKFQEWALSFRSKPELSYVNDVYVSMQHEGIHFPPPPTNLSAALLSTTTAPAWIDSEVCLRCRTAFSFTNRKHHCRNCGKVFDQQCSSHTMALPHFGITDEVRVCDGCWAKKRPTDHKSNASGLPPPTVPSKSLNPDSDLARAIALSLAESKASSGSSRPGFVPAAPNGAASEPPIYGGKSKSGRKSEGVDRGEDEEDEDLRAAIEASLAEMRDAPSAPDGLPGPPEERQGSFGNPVDLTPRETDAILTFSQTIEQVARQGGADLNRYPHAHELYANANGLRGKLYEGMNDAGRKEHVLNDMQTKLSSAVMLYDQLLTEQHAHSERQRQMQLQQQQYQQPQYPYQQSFYGVYPQQQPYGAQPYPSAQPPHPSLYPQQNAPPWGGSTTPTPQQPYPSHYSNPYSQQTSAPPAQSSSIYPQLPTSPAPSNAPYQSSQTPTPQSWAPSHQQQQQPQYNWDPARNAWLPAPAPPRAQTPHQGPSQPSETFYPQQAQASYPAEPQQLQPSSPSQPTAQPLSPSTSLNPNAPSWTPSSGLANLSISSPSAPSEPQQHLSNPHPEQHHPSYPDQQASQPSYPSSAPAHQQPYYPGQPQQEAPSFPSVPTHPTAAFPSVPDQPIEDGKKEEDEPEEGLLIAL